MANKISQFKIEDAMDIYIEHSDTWDIHRALNDSQFHVYCIIFITEEWNLIPFTDLQKRDKTL